MKKIYCLSLLLIAFFCKAQIPADVAQNFGSFLGLSGNITSVTVQTDGKIILAGNFTSYNGISENNIIRLNADGTKDTSFTTTGAGFNGQVSSIALQADGKIIAGGLFTTYNGETVNRIIRLNANGTRDTSFTTGTGFNNNIRSITAQSDGKILIGGDFTSYNGVTENRIIRLNADGTKDTSFTIGTGFNSTVYSIVVQSDSKIIVGGTFTTYNGITENRIIRLNVNGTKDSSLITGSGFNNGVFSIALQTDGKIIVGGFFTLYNGVASNYLIRLNADGTVNTAGTGLNNSVNSIALQSDGKVILSGNFTTVDSVTANRIVRLNADGTNDNSFTSGAGLPSAPSSIALQSDGKIIVGGFFTSYNNLLENPFIRLNANGTKDTSFASTLGTGFSSAIVPITLQSDGKILIGGAFTAYNGTAENRIIRLNADGTKDTSFNTGLGFNNSPRSIIVQSDGKILVGGGFTSFNGVTENRIIRLNTDGTRDISFITGTGINQFVLSMALQSDGKILVVGLFSVYNGVTENGIIRLNPNGTKDTSFNSGSGFLPVNAFITSIVVQTDGKILVGGGFTTFNGVTAQRFIRLNTDGTIDTSFSTGLGFTGGGSQVECIAVQSDGKIMVGGVFLAYNGVAANSIVRLNANGTIDTSFNSGTGFNSTVSSIAIKSDGKIIVGGLFTSFNGVTENYIIRLNADGTKDTSFNTGTGFNSSVNSITIQTGDKILIGGSFTIYKGNNSSAFLISLHNNGTLSNTTFTSSSDFTLWPNPVQDVLHIDAVETTTVLSVALYDLQGKLLNENSFDNGNAISVSSLAAGLYLVTIKTADGEFTKKFVKE